MIKEIKIATYDTTLRDGAQTPGVNYTVDNKARIAERLDQMGFLYIEGGWPEANPTDSEFFKQLRGHKFNRAQLVAFGMTGRVGIKAEDDLGLAALLESGTEVITIFGKSSLLHVREVLRTDPRNNLKSIYDSVEFLIGEGRRVFYDAEHFFDGYKESARYAISTLLEAKKAGAESIVLCDTKGGSTPEFIYQTTRRVRKKLGEDFPLGIHVHNDRGLAVINTIAAVRGGATQVQGTINGAGERTGNVDFCVFLPAAEFSYGITAEGIDLTKLPQLARFVELENGLRIPHNQPFVGTNAFTHKGGVHVDAVRKNPTAYEHIEPELVGRERSFENSDQGGGANVLEMAEKYGKKLEKSDPRVKGLVEKMKELGILGDAQEFLLLYRELTGGNEPFEIDEETYVEISWDAGWAFSYVRVRVGDEELKSNLGTAPSSLGAFDDALTYTLEPKFPEIKDIKILDYRAQSSGQQFGWGETEVYLEFGANDIRWTSRFRGQSEESASQRALVDGYKYYILRYIKRKNLS